MIEYILSSKVGVNNGEGPPVPIPNTEVKLIRAEDTWRATAWENRSMPTLIVPIPNTEVKLIRAEDTWRATAWENRSMPTLINPAWQEVEQSPNRAVVFYFILLTIFDVYSIIKI